jgi:hypothetical protein
MGEWMKNQYFGDAREYFKYDVLDRLASDLDGIRLLICLWMLTPSDDTTPGQVKFTPSPELWELTSFFSDRPPGKVRRTHLEPSGATFPALGAGGRRPPSPTSRSAP